MFSTNVVGKQCTGSTLFSSLLTCTLGGYNDGFHTCVPATYMRDLHGMLSAAGFGLLQPELLHLFIFKDLFESLQQRIEIFHPAGSLPKWLPQQGPRNEDHLLLLSQAH